MRLESAFGQILREHRRKNKISQEALALQSGLDRTFMSKLERGIRQPTLMSLFKIANALNISPSQIISEVESLVTKDKKTEQP